MNLWQKKPTTQTTLSNEYGVCAVHKHTVHKKNCGHIFLIHCDPKLKSKWLTILLCYIVVN